jgi:hypothetical protein
MRADMPTMKTFSLRLPRAPRSTLSPSVLGSLSRLEARPPSLRHAPESLWQRLLFWLMAPTDGAASPPLNRLPGVQRDFQLALADVPAPRRTALALRIQQARSLRELWHMRVDVYTLLAQAHSEFEAAERLAQLNRHFPTKAPRSGFAPLGPAVR